MTAVLPAWPAGLIAPEPLNDSLDQTYPDLITRTDFDQGAARQRSNWSSGPTAQTITWPMDPTQARIFHGFWAGEISNGADWFTLPIFNDDTYRTFTVRFVGGQPTKLTRSGGEWIYIAQIETDDVTAPDEYETAELMLTYGVDESLGSIVATFDAAVHAIYEAP